MLACSHTVMYRDGECESEIDEVTGKGIISIQGPSFLLSFCMHVICGCCVRMCLEGSGFINENGIRIARAMPNFNHPLVSYIYKK